MKDLFNRGKETEKKKAIMKGAVSLEKWKLLLDMTAVKTAHSNKCNHSNEVMFVFSSFQGVKIMSVFSKLVVFYCVVKSSKNETSWNVQSVYTAQKHCSG